MLLLEGSSNLINGGCYDIAKSNHTESVTSIYQEHCESYGFTFETYSSVLPPDDTTLFTTSGMQKRKHQFTDSQTPKQTICDIQHCLRLRDLNEVGDHTHLLDFWMLGLFSFRNMQIASCIKFWMEFLTKISVFPTHVTVHPDCSEWFKLWTPYNLPVKYDNDCKWSDGNIGGYCTELYVNDIEIGNIVLPLGDCLDCGFGLERLMYVTTDTSLQSSFLSLSSRTERRKLVFNQTISVLLQEGIQVSGSGRGHELKKLIRLGLRENLLNIEHPVIDSERKKFNRILEQLPVLIKKYPDRDALFFKNTFGIDPIYYDAFVS